MATNGKKRDPRSHLEPREAALRILALREMKTEALALARMQAEDKVRERYLEKEQQLLDRVGESNRERVIKWVAALERDQMGRTQLDGAGTLEGDESFEP